jgi:chemotaxis protein MotA
LGLGSPVNSSLLDVPDSRWPEERTLDKASIFGVFTGIALVLTAILLGSSIGTFVNVQGLLIVAGGTVAATSIAFPTEELKLIWPVSRRVFNDPGDEMVAISQFLVKSLQVFKRDGPVALEKISGEAPSKPLVKGLLLIADNTDAATIKEILATERKYMEEHHRIGQKMFSEMGKYAPAFGMVGTLIGLVQMLADMSDPDNLGPAMAVALLTTFYGAVMANLIFLPMVTKLDRRIGIEVVQIQLVIVGLESMYRGDSSQILKEKLAAFMNQQEHKVEAALQAAA